MTAHKHAEAIKAWADGAQIQIKEYDTEVWKDCDPQWAENREYRVKPVPLCQVEGKDVFPGDRLWVRNLGWGTAKAAHDSEYIQLVMDGCVHHGLYRIDTLSWSEPLRTKTVYQWAIKDVKGNWFVATWLCATEAEIRNYFKPNPFPAVSRLDYTALEVKV